MKSMFTSFAPVFVAIALVASIYPPSYADVVAGMMDAIEKTEKQIVTYRQTSAARPA